MYFFSYGSNILSLVHPFSLFVSPLIYFPSSKFPPFYFPAFPFLLPSISSFAFFILCHSSFPPTIYFCVPLSSSLPSPLFPSTISLPSPLSLSRIFPYVFLFSSFFFSCLLFSYFFFSFSSLSLIYSFFFHT